MRYRQIYLALIFSFLIGIHEGFVALWLQSGGEPDYVFPYSASSLPPADQKRLKKGIEIQTKEELAALLEDYFS